MAATTVSESKSPVMPWWLFLIEGIALVILGLLFLSKPGMTTLIAIQFLGLYWLVSGLMKIVTIFIDSSQWGWKLLFGVIGIIAGIVVVQHPVWSSAIVLDTTILILGLIGIFMGIISIIQAFQGGGWAAVLLGALSLILGLVLIANRWWFTFSLPITLGVLSIVGGLVAVYWAFRARGEESMAPAAAAVRTEPKPAEMAPVIEESVVKKPAAEMKEEIPPAVEPVEEEPVGMATDEEAVLSGLEAAALHAKLESVQGIGPKYAQDLNEAGINSPGDLLEKCTTPKGREELSEQTGISSKLILTWANHADLFRITGVAGQYGELLEATGVDTVPELAQRNPQNLYEAMVKVNSEKHLVHHVPSESQVESWVAQAKELPRILQY